MAETMNSRKRVHVSQRGCGRVRTRRWAGHALSWLAEWRPGILGGKQLPAPWHRARLSALCGCCAVRGLVVLNYQRAERGWTARLGAEGRMRVRGEALDCWHMYVGWPRSTGTGAAGRGRDAAS